MARPIEPTLTGTVFDIRKFSIQDGPGIRTTVFFKGCPLSCWWCHNPESQSQKPELIYLENRCIRCGMCLEICPQGAITSIGKPFQVDLERCTLCGACVETCVAEARQLVGKEMTVAEVMAVIEQDIPFYDESGGGVTFSGGEPLNQPAFLVALLLACKSQEIHTTLDTSGYASWRTLNQVRPLVDLFYYDLKLMDHQAHIQYTGVSNHLILENLQNLSDLGHALVIRVPVIPGITDTMANIQEIGDFASQLDGVQRVDLLPYHHIASDKYHRLQKPFKIVHINQPDESHMDYLADLLRSFGLQVKVGG